MFQCTYTAIKIFLNGDNNIKIQKLKGDKTSVPVPNRQKQIFSKMSVFSVIQFLVLIFLSLVPPSKYKILTDQY